MKFVNKIMVPCLLVLVAVMLVALLVPAFAGIKRNIQLENELDVRRHNMAVVDCAGAKMFRTLYAKQEAPPSIEVYRAECEIIVTEKESIKNQIAEFWEMFKQSAKYLFS